MKLSDVDLCNLALSRASAHSITQITALGEASHEARQCAIKYPHVRRIALRNHPWLFATKRESLALIGSGNSNFKYRYQYPGDCLLVRAIENQDGHMMYSRFDISSFATELGSDNTRNILCNVPNAELVYTADVEDVNTWDSLFYDALAWQLAAELALTLGNDGGKARYLEEKAMHAWDYARTSNSSEEYEPLYVGSYITARGN